MILRSVTKHVKEQNWFAVVLDLVIVIFGVFIGIQVANWNDGLTGDEKTKVLIKRMVADLNYESEAISAVLNYHSIVQNYAVTAVDALNGKKTVNDEQFVISAFQASQITLPWTYRSAYNELLRTGYFDLIKSEELKGLILGYYSFEWTQSTLMTTTAPYREYIRGVLPFLIQDTIRNECGDFDIALPGTTASLLPDSCELQLPDELFSETAAYLRSQPDTLIKLQYQIAVNQSMVANLVSTKEYVQMLLTAIEEFQE
jgi:hypothetical protein